MEAIPLTKTERKELYQECVKFWQYMKDTDPNFREQIKKFDHL